ncbi:ornithine cyclodeaminase family protein [Streptomyces sp. MBT62]|uniref:ornithine cyclodeaminase family protein n=1 Tax=Streptomyces sp. MBT62 TaxID=2800410 RepID=UPI00190B802D|nr:ornithine cyclodeaminase family protein [Streptomyces sp. MBT62]MBK3568792.1 ornithine cyclodeaminase family protein [Streptomyces sp. MBT62]
MTSFEHLPILSAADVERALTRDRAAAALTRALRAGLEPGEDLERSVLDVAGGQLLLMPSAGAAVGLKAVTLAPGNPGRGLPRIQGAYLLFGAETLELRAIMDGVAVTNLRTPAVSVAATDPLLTRFTRPIELVVFGAGPQAVGHVDAIRAIGSVEPADVTYVVRRPDRAREQLPPHATVVAADSPEVPVRLGRAQVVVCATSARGPLFDSAHVTDGSVVIAVGSHEPDVRELDGSLMARANVVVEDVGTALREAGDVVMAIREGRLRADELIPMADVVRGTRTLAPDRTAVFKSVGMSWQDLVVAEEIVEQHLRGR